MAASSRSERCLDGTRDWRYSGRFEWMIRSTSAICSVNIVPVQIDHLERNLRFDPVNPDHCYESQIADPMVKHAWSGSDIEHPARRPITVSECPSKPLAKYSRHLMAKTRGRISGVKAIRRNCSVASASPNLTMAIQRGLDDGGRMKTLWGGWGDVSFRIRA